MSYSQDFRDAVINAYKKKGYKNSKLSNLFGISLPTAREWIKRYHATGDYSSKQGVGCGRECLFTNRDAVVDYIKIHPDANAIEIRNAVAPELHMNTFYDTLKRMKITYKKRAKI